MGDGNGLKNGSFVTCPFIETTQDDPKLIPRSIKRTRGVLHGEALAFGLCEARIATQRELARLIEIRAESWIKRQKAKICRTITWFEKR